jgi:hypothetical protein
MSDAVCRAAAQPTTRLHIPARLRSPPHEVILAPVCGWQEKAAWLSPPKEKPRDAGPFFQHIAGSNERQAIAGSVGVAGAEGERGPRAKRVASILRRSSTPCPLPVTLSTA